jgi:hypothetical protein
MSDETLRELRCDDCAFTAGTQANGSAVTRLKARLCVENALPFYCHKREGMCAGWAEGVNKAAECGAFVRLQSFRRDVAERCLEVLSSGEERVARGEEVTDASVAEDVYRAFGDSEFARQVIEEYENHTPSHETVIS